MVSSMTKNNTQAILLAAGKGSRFKTKRSKLLYNICGRAMVLYPTKMLEKLNIPTTLVLGYQADDIKKTVEQAKIPNISYTLQETMLGTGNALAESQSHWKHDNILVMNGDTPLVSEEIIQRLIHEHERHNAAVSFCTTMVLNPEGYGRVVEKDNHLKIVEEKDCTPEEESINRINAGIYLFSKKFLINNIENIEKSPNTGEFYIVDLIKMASDQNLPINTLQVPYDNVRGVNTLQDLWSVEQIKRSEFIKHWMAHGVQFELAQSIHIDINVTIGQGSFIGTGVHLMGDTTIGEDCTIRAYSIIEDSTIGNNTTINYHSVIQKSRMGNNVEIGPFARLRDDVILGDDVNIGNFVEIKSTTIGNKTKTKHLSYLGNATIGNSVNIGAGTIICNYDGVNKTSTVIEDDVFIGSNNTLISPMHIGKGAYTAGGSTLKGSIPADSLAIERSQQQIKSGYAKKIRTKKKLDKKTDDDMSFQGAIKTTNTESNKTV